jgi:DNA-binding SARP family transcriptional activator/tetratricopeptide (TPR) repeat protein
VRFFILGPLRVAGDAGEITLVPGRERTTLALLLLNANRLVTVDELVDTIWGEAPPSTARGQVQTSVSRLRRLLRTTGVDDAIVVTDSIGYVIRVPPEDLDSFQFTNLMVAARKTLDGGRPERARELFRAGLALWRGSALAGITGCGVAPAAARLEEQRSTAAEDCIGVELELGLEREVVDELADLVDRHPLRERLRGLLMLTLYRLGRHAEALSVYRDGRQLLSRELGIEPNAELQELHRRMLNRDPALTAPPASTPPPGRCLPRDVADFTGRDEAIAELLTCMSDPTAPTVATVDGMAGMGKTALAVHVAHRVSERYPDAQLFVDLHGHSARAPLDPAAALGTLLRQLGIAADRVPEHLEDRIALWRTESAGRRILTVLDNAADTDQILPLLPGGARSLTLVTSRRRLAGLDGAHPVSLEVLSSDEAVQLLRRVVGDRVGAEPAAAAEVARLCGYLPLAVRLAAARLAHRPKWSVADLASRLRTAAPLAELAVEGRTVASAFTLSYEHLDEPAQRVFRLLGLHPGADFDAYAVAALADTPVDDARGVLEGLVDVHLVEATSVHRYRLHDLLRDFARDLVAGGEPEPVRHEAIGRLLDYYLYATAQATAHFEHTETRSGLDLGESPLQIPILDDRSRAGTWLETEWPNVIAAIHRSDALQRHRYTLRLSRALWIHLWRHGHSAESIDIHERAVLAAQQLGDLAIEASARNYLASGYHRLGRHEAAIIEVRKCIAVRRQLRDTSGVAFALANLGLLCHNIGRLEEALQYLEESTSIAEQHDLTRVLATSDHLPTVYVRLGRYADAMARSRLNLAAARRAGHLHSQGVALGMIGVVHSRLGHHKLALALLTRSVEMKRIVGLPSGRAETMSELGSVYRTLGRLEQALLYQQEALDAVRQVRDDVAEVRILNDLGHTLLALGNEGTATDFHRQAMRTAQRIDARFELAQAYDGLGCALRGTDPEAARQHWRQALELFTEMGVPERFEVERRLAELDADQDALG